MLHCRRRSILIAALGLAGGLLGALCGHEEDRIRLTNADSGRTIVVHVGDEFDIALEVPVGPFYYGTPVVSSGSVRFLNEFDEVPGPPVNPGGGKTQRFEFEAVSAGQADITIQRELPGGSPQTFQVTVQVH
jgi:hypothetical protein